MRFLIACLVLSWPITLLAEEQGDSKSALALVAKHCVRCHGAEKPKGDFRLDRVNAQFAHHQSSWAAALERLQAGDMPPEGEPQPSEAERKIAMAWIARELAAARPSGPPLDDAIPAPIKPVDGNHVPHALLFGTAAKEVIPAKPRLWRLSPQAYTDGLVDALKGSGRKELAQPFNLISDPGIKDFDQLYTIDGPGTEVLIRNAERIVEGQTNHKLVEENGSVRVQMGNDTIGDFRPLIHPKTPPTSADLEKAIRAQYRLALAREPSGEEISRLKALYEKNLQSTSDHIAAAKGMLMAPLLSPEAVFRFELGLGAEVRPGVRMLSPHETAIAINLALADRRERGLFDAAARGGLTTREDVAVHVRRILDDPKIAKRRLLGFFREYFGYDHAPNVFKDKPNDVLFTPEQMVRDTDQLILHLVERDQEVLKELLTTRQSFVNYQAKLNDKTKQLEVKRAQEAHPINDKGRKHPEAAYGFSDWPAKQPVDLPGDRIGILMQPSWLVAWSGNFDNDPVRRGRWVRERLLGGRVPDLPLGVAAKVPDEPDQTLRHRHRVTRESQCWKCHQKMDDLGLPFEQFDHYGKPRLAELVLDKEKTDANVDKKGKPLGPVHREAPLDSTGAIAQSGDTKIDGPVRDPAEMVRRLAQSDRVRQVFIRHVFRYYMGRNETPGDALTLQEADRTYTSSGGSYKSLLVSLLSSESFLYRSVPSSDDNK